MTKAHTPHLLIILESCAAITKYRPATLQNYLANPMVQDAILMRLQVIGEHLAKLRQIDSEWFASVADQGWYEVIGLRNVISHGYEEIDPQKIWAAITLELPHFAERIESMLDHS